MFRVLNVVYNWVKIVNKLGVHSANSCGLIYTAEQLFNPNTPTNSEKLPTFSLFNTVYSAQLSTTFLANFNLLIRHLYPLSTAPTITTTNKIMINKS